MISAMPFLGAMLLQLTGGAAGAVQYQSNKTIVIVAHQDDWQLFMGDLIGKELKGGGSATFIYITAGDDGRDSLYWQTRERAALKSTTLALGWPPRDSAERCATVVARAHLIRHCIVGKTSSYFLRLPDGRRNGAGFLRYGNQSLRKLRTNAIRLITAVDGSTTYNGWSDLVATVGDLISLGDPGNSGRVHTTDPSIAVNPHDHFDHRLAGLLVVDLRPRLTQAPLYYVGYALSTRAPNRSGEQVREKTAIFRAYDAEMVRVNSKWGAYAEHPAFYSQCMLRTYRRSGPRQRSR